jgi:putative endonuclease
MTERTRTLGRWGEDAAAACLLGRGYTLLARNLHSVQGEIDLVACKDGLLVFLEVMTRSFHSFAFPEASVTLHKQAYLMSAAETYLEQHLESGDTWQFDVIAIEGKPGGKPQIEHFENVFG